MKSPFIQVGNVKIKIDDLPDEAWEFIVGGDGGAPDLRKYFKSVAWLNRGVKLRKNHVAAMPFKIYKGDTIYDESGDYQNKVMFLPNIKGFLGMVEQGLTMNGREYQFIQRTAMLGRGVASGLRHMVASSVTPKYNDRIDEGVYGELVGFKRKTKAGVEELDLNQVLYFWYQDDSVEIGPPTDWPALAALQAAGVLHAVNDFATMFFERGAIKVTLLTTKGNVVPATREALKTWWNRIRGNSWAAEIVNADQVEVVPVGEGLESLANTELTKDQREDIATALGVPHSMLFSNAANYATSQQDKMNFYEDTIIPECTFIEGVVNEQLFEPLGLRLAFDPQELAIFQEDEEQRSSAFFNYVASTIRPSIAGEVLGMEMPEGIEYSALDEKWEIDLKLAEKMATAPDKESTYTAGNAIAEGTNPRQPEKGLSIDLEKWERKALKRIQRGNDPACGFDSEYIPAIMLGAIEGALETTTNNPALVKAVFADVWMGYP